MKKFKNPANFIDLLHIAFHYGEGYKEIIADQGALLWVKEMAENYPKKDRTYETMFGTFSISFFAMGMGEDDMYGLTIRNKEDNTFFWYDIKSQEYVWIVGAKLMDLKNFPEFKHLV